ncbi:MAG: bifunctional phosphoribosylaminoimidazolecarboxamide formyltransferase/IMP cyclohydrolase [Acidobacteriota bacterium]
MASIERALLSVTDKTGIVEFAKALTALGIEILSTGGTFRVLKDAGISPLREVAEVTEFPEMLDGRVKTLHPRVAGGILAMRSKPEHMDAIAAHGIPRIDLVCVNLYAFEKIAAKPDATLEELIENIDIGGPTMIRAAAKNWQDVAIVTAPEDYQLVIAELQAGSGLSEATHWRLARAAFSRTAAYDRAISARLAEIDAPSHVPAPVDLNAPPALLDIRVPRRMSLRYGENPHQAAALYASGHQGIAGAEQLQGKELSYNNLTDLDAAWQLVLEFDKPAAAIIKHANPCGCAEGPELVEAYRRAFEADPKSAFGGVLAFNRTVDGTTAAEILETFGKAFAEAIAAPDYTAEAREILAPKKNLRVIRVAAALPEMVVKSITGGFLVQTADSHVLLRSEAVVKTKRAPTAEEWTALEFGWKISKHVKSNAIVYARNVPHASGNFGQTISAGAGQMSRVDSAIFGAMRAVLPLQGSVVASDAFFPFPDGLEEAAKHGVTAAIQPGGSMRDDDVIAAADRLGLAMVFTGVRHFRH